MAVHPHTGGEHVITITCSPHIYGSSPHGWGTQCRPGRRCGNVRFIPTRVGNTLVLVRVWSYTAVHPHTGGEHMFEGFQFPDSSGSSPHGWGTRKTGYPTAGRCAVHPHTGGEHCPAVRCPVGSVGSSPHGWGTPFYQALSVSAYRFIPTRVGNTYLIERVML